MSKSLMFIFFFLIKMTAFGQHTPNYESLGDKSYKKENYAEAKKYYTLALNGKNLQRDTIAWIYLMRANCYANLEDFANGVRDCTSAVNFDHTLIEAYLDRAGFYGNLNEFTNSITDYHKCIALLDKNQHDKLKGIYNGLADSYLGARNINNALKYSALSIHEDTSWNMSYYERGLIFQYLKKIPESIDCFNHAITNTYVGDKDDLETFYMERANSEKLEKHERNAIKDYNYVIELNPDNEDAYGSRADCYYAIQDYKSAMRDCNRTMSFFQDDKGQLAELYDFRALIELQQSLYNDAIKDDSVSISLNPHVVPVYIDIAVAYTGNGDYNSAIVKCRKALAFKANSNIDNSLIYAHIGENEYRLKQNEKAVIDLNKSIQLNPQNFYSYYFRGLTALYRSGNKNQAIADFNKVLNLDTSQKTQDYIFALFYTGKQAQAIAIIQQMLAGANNIVADRTERYVLACLYALEDDANDANTELEMAINEGYPIKEALSDEAFDKIRSTHDYKRITNR